MSSANYPSKAVTTHIVHKVVRLVIFDPGVECKTVQMFRSTIN